MYRTYNSIEEVLSDYRRMLPALQALGSHLRFKVEAFLTPKLGVEGLNRNPINRDIKPAKVKQFLADMEAGQWGRSTQDICISESGELVDGQNRLEALRQFGSPVLMMIEVCTDEEAPVIRENIDYNLTPRSKSDMVQIFAVQHGLEKPSKTHVEVLNAIATILYSRNCSWRDSNHLDGVFGQDIDDMLKASNSHQKNRATAPVKAAFVLRLHNATPFQRELMLDQWRKFSSYDIRNANNVNVDDQVLLLLSTLDKYSTTKTGGTSITKDRAVISWQGWDLFGQRRKKLIQSPTPKSKNYTADLAKFEGLYEEMQMAISDAINPHYKLNVA